MSDNASWGHRLSLVVNALDTSAELAFEVRRVWNGGWAGRDEGAVRRHIDELKMLGVPAPRTTPIFFPLSSNLATTAGRIQVLGPDTSGEVEFALLFTGGRSYVTVASDHTDRGFERFGIQASKQLYPNVLAREVWPYEECAAHWDRLTLRCWVAKDEHRTLYQQAPLSELLSSEEWLARLDRAGVDREGLIFLSGTFATVGGLVFGDAYDIEIEDPILGRSIRHRYEVEVLGSGQQ